jgi:hypothetical protein
MESNNRETRYNRRNTVTYGYITIPSNVDRGKYVANCLLTNIVSIMTIDGEFILHCMIDSDLLQRIDFPDKFPDLGSGVLILTEPIKNQAFAVAKFNKGADSHLSNENEWRMRKVTKNGIIEVSGNADSGSVFIKAESYKDSGGLFIDVSNSSDSAQLKLNVGGNINLYCKGDLNAQIDGKVTIYDKDDLTLKSDTKIIQNAGSSPEVLGDKIVDQITKESQALTDSINAILNVTPVVVPAGALDPTWALVITALTAITDRGDFSKVNSKKSFLE